jgi:hypothetical protein
MKKRSNQQQMSGDGTPSKKKNARQMEKWLKNT